MTILSIASARVGIAEKDLTQHQNGGAVKAKMSFVPASCVMLDKAVVCGKPTIDATPDTYVEIKGEATIKGGTIGKYAKISGTAVVLDGAIVPDYATLTSGTLIGELPCEKVGEWYMGLCGPGIAYIGCHSGDEKYWEETLVPLGKEFGITDEKEVDVYRKKLEALFALKSPFEIPE